MAKQTFTTGQVLTAAQMTSLQQTAMGGGSTTAKTTSYVLTAADAGTVVAMNAAGATTITVNTGLFSAGDTVFIQNWGAGTCTVTAGTATVTTHGSLALGQWEGGTLYFTSASAAIFFDISQTSGMTNPMTTTGDTIYSSSGSTPARLGIGSTGQVLTVAGGVPSWATPASGGGMTLITETSASNVSSVNFTSISGSYKQLMVVWNGVEVGSSTNFQWRFNNDSNSIYSVSARFSGQGSTMSVDNTAGFYDTAAPPINSDLTSTNNERGKGYLIIDNYASTSKYKTYWYSFSYRDGGSRNYLFMGNCLFESTSAITSLDLVRTYGSVNLSNSANTSFRLYGIS